jgi:hypothetical protein
MRNALLLRDPSDPDQQATNLLRGAVPSRWQAAPTVKQLRHQTTGIARVYVPLAAALPFPSGRL